jgi:hypothetical protein
MNIKQSWITIACFAIGCGSSPATQPDLGMTPPPTGDLAVMACTPMAKECVTNQLARVCPADGSGWLALQCPQGQICMMGDCKPDLNAACIPGDGVCVDANNALRCRANGMGYDMVRCPDKTNCAGNGQCQGSCVVGSAVCLDTHTLSTCGDGTTFTNSSCMANTLCVDQTVGGGAPMAACLPSECTPDPLCGLVCGNKGNPTAPNQEQYISLCQSTPNGYKWISAQCQAPSTCNPTAGGQCSATGFNAGCAADCNPGDQRCAGDGHSTQLCDSMGHWQTNMVCDQTTFQACMTDPSNMKAVLCGDLLCARGFAGTCDAQGGFRACGSNGKVAATGTPCTGGVCSALPPPMIPVGGSYQPGQCAAECQTGDTRCPADGSSVFQQCMNGLWTTGTSCPTGTLCYGYVANGRSASVCGECAPGSHRCTNNNGALDGGVPSGGGDTYPDIETCGAMGTWGAPAACPMGVCTLTPSGSDATCMTQCVPGQTVCIGAASTTASPGLTIVGTTGSTVCNANGFPSTKPTDVKMCTGEQTCRKNVSGNGIGCVVCVGPGVSGGNENGLVDTRCDPNAVDVQVCKATNTWPTMASTACTGAQMCVDPDPITPLPTRTDAYCHPCDANSIGPCVADPFFGCFDNSSSTVSCNGTPAGTTVSACCANSCRVDPSPNPAFCK